MENKKLKSRITGVAEVSEIVQGYFCKNQNVLAMSILFGGDRLAVCDEAVIAENENGQFVGMATISPRGEMDEGVPTIVGLFVDKTFRGQKFGVQILEATIQRMLARGFTEIKIDLLSIGAKRSVEKLPEDFKKVLIISDQVNPMISMSLAL